LLAQTDDFQPNNSATPFDTYVMVIGESARRDFMHVYGFPINNTPFMDSANGILFNHYISAALSTIPSLTSSLTQAPKLANSVIALTKNGDLLPIGYQIRELLVSTTHRLPLWGKSRSFVFSKKSKL